MRSVGRPCTSGWCVMPPAVWRAWSTRARSSTRAPIRCRPLVSPRARLERVGSTAGEWHFPDSNSAWEGPSDSVLGLLQMFVIFGIGFAALRPTDQGVRVWRALIAATLEVTVIAMGLAITAVVRTVQQLNAIGNIAPVGLGALDGALVPLATPPAWLHHVAPATPQYWPMRRFNGLTLGGQSRTAICPTPYRSVARLWNCFRHGCGRGDPHRRKPTLVRIAAPIGSGSREPRRLTMWRGWVPEVCPECSRAPPFARLCRPR